MEDLFKMYRCGLISWENTYVKASNHMVLASEKGYTDDVEYWISQVQSLAEDAANMLIKRFGYYETEEGILRK